MLQISQCSLRKLEEGDLPLLLRWRNSERVRTAMIHDGIILPEEHGAWFRKIEAGKQDDCRLFMIGERPSGFMHIFDIDERNGTCRWGFYIGEADSPKGSGTAMGRMALRQIFCEMKLRKCCAEILASNRASLHFHAKLGFCEEGRLRKQIRRGEHFEDLLLMALFAEDWFMAQNINLLKDEAGENKHGSV